MIALRVTGQSLIRTDYHPVVADSKNYLTARFCFDQPWAGLGKTAVFTGQGKSYHVLLEQDQCLVPHEVIHIPGFTVSVFGGDLITANSVEIPVEPSGLAEGETPSPPTADIYSQITAQLAAKADGLLLSGGVLRLTAGGLPIGQGIVLPAGGTGAKELYSFDFTADRFLREGERYQLVIPAADHRLGANAVVCELMRRSEQGFDNLAVQYRRLSSGDIVVYTHQPFDGRIVMEGV